MGSASIGPSVFGKLQDPAAGRGAATAADVDMAMPAPRSLRRGDVELAVYEWPAPERPAPVIVLVHGYPDSARVWQRVAALLAPRFRVVAYDVRGAGHSGRPGPVAAYDLDELVADMAAVVDDVCPAGGVHLVGHDWGSIQGWEAVTTAALAGRIASFTSISGPGLDHVGYWAARRLRGASPARWSQLVRQLGHSWYVGAFHVPLAFPALWRAGLGRRWPALLARKEGVAVDASGTQAADGADGVKLYRANFRKRLLHPRERRTDVPVQLLCPRRDRFMVAEIWDDLPRWANRLWRRDVDAGHWLQLSHPRRLAAWVAEFAGFVESGREGPALRRARQRAAAMGKPDAGRRVVTNGAASRFVPRLVRRLARLRPKT